MRKFIKVLGLVACISAVSVFPSFADDGGGGDDGGGRGAGVPAPEIGATVLGLLGAAGLAAYLRARRRG